MMPAPTPYDLTTPPSTPRTITHLQTPRHSSSTRTSQFAVDPRHGRPAALHHAPRPAPRECQNGPQDDWYYTVTKDAYMFPSIFGARKVGSNPNACAPLFSGSQIRSIQPRGLGRKLERNTLRFITPLTAAIPKDMSKPVLPSPPPAKSSPTSVPVSKIGTAAKATGWVQNIRKKRRPSEIFNINFSFAITSRRRSSSSIAQISPRTSICEGSSSTLPSREDSFKRQRVDSTGSDVTLGFPFGKAALATSSRGRDLGSLSPTVSPSKPPNLTGEVHPGCFVDFTSARQSEQDAQRFASHPMSESNLRLGTEAYHDYLTESLRRKSFPTIDCAAQRIHQEVTMLAKLKKLDTEATKGATAGRTRNRTLECKTQSPSSSSSSSTTNPSGPNTPATPTSLPTKAEPGILRRTISDPSTEAFLAHIRASLATRKSRDMKPGSPNWAAYPVFADECEKGFLNDEPL